MAVETACGVVESDRHGKGYDGKEDEKESCWSVPDFQRTPTREDLRVAAHPRFALVFLPSTSLRRPSPVMVDQSLLLDSSIRDWVLLPITLVILLVGLLRHNIVMLITTPPKKSEPLDLRQQRIMTRSGALRTNHTQIPPNSFIAKRQRVMNDLSSGKFLKESPEDVANKPKEEATPANPLGDANAMDGMMDQMKKSMVMMIPQQLIMGWIGFFFSGFVVAKIPVQLPFPLDYFKGWLQRGITSENVEIGWVSSISWYFLVAFFGLNAIYRLLLGDENAADSTRDMMGPLGGAGGGQAAAPPSMAKMDFSKLHETERETLERVGKELLEAPPPTRKTIDGKSLTGFGGKKGEKGGKKWVGDGIEERVLEKYGRIVLA